MMTARSVAGYCIMIVKPSLRATGRRECAPERHCERSEAIHWERATVLDCFVASAPRNDVEPQIRLYDPAARCARVVHEFSPRKKEGVRECRVPAAPAASCAKVE